MPSLSLKDFHINNLLDELDLNPFWVKLRRFGFYVCVAASLFYLYSVRDLKVHCDPVFENGTLIKRASFSGASAGRINTCCRNDPKFSAILRSGWIMLIANSILLLLPLVWLHSDPTVDLIRTFVKARGLISNSNMTIDSIKASMKSYIKSNRDEKTDKEESIMVRKVCCMLCFAKSETNVFIKYFIVELLQFYFLGFASPALVQSYVHHPIQFRRFQVTAPPLSEIETVFICDYNSTTAHRWYSCAYGPIETIYLSSVTFQIGTYVQFCTSLYAINKLTQYRISPEIGGPASPFFMALMAIFLFGLALRSLFLTEEEFQLLLLLSFIILIGLLLLNIDFEHDVKGGSFKFFAYLSANAQGSKFGLSKSFIDFMFSEDFSKSVERRVEEILKNGDVELLKIHQKASERTFSAAINVFTEIEHQSAEYFEAIAKSVNYEVKECHRFIEWAVKNEQWRHLVIFLNYSQSDLNNVDDNTFNLCREQTVNFDSIMIPSVKSANAMFPKEIFYEEESLLRCAGNLLYFALNAQFGENRKGADKVTNFILRNFPAHTPFVHFSKTEDEGDTSIEALTYLNDLDYSFHMYALGVIKIQKHHDKSSVRKRLVELVSGEEDILNQECQEVIKREYNKYQELVDTDDFNLLKGFAENLVTKKFHTWDEDAINFLELANRTANEKTKEHWIVLIALLDAYIVTDERKLDCVVNLPGKEAIDDVFVKAMLWESPLGYISRGPHHIIKKATQDQRKEIKEQLKKNHDNKNHDNKCAQKLIGFIGGLEQ